MPAASDQDRTLAEAAGLLAGRRRLLVLLGAGASADAGVPTFRGTDGLWQQVRPEDLASAEGFRRDPQGVWAWYRQRRWEIAQCQPHAGQRAIALLQRHLGSRVLVATTNEDDLLERAGVDRVVHLHGAIFNTSCVANCGWVVDDRLDGSWSYLTCPDCQAAVRPGSVWFGEEVPSRVLVRIEHFRAEACLVVGSSSLVQPVAAIAPEMALAGRPVVEVNAETTPLSSVATSLRGRAVDLLPALIDLITSATVRERVMSTVGK